jgi:LmbE family N-acetylglucosaminyl deacetylase
MRVLVIMAHPDDIEFGVSGSVARWIDEGAQVTYVIATDGAAGSNDPNADPDELRDLRKQEQIAAAMAVGMQPSDVIFLDYADGTLTPTIELRRDLTRLIRRYQPDRVITFDPTTLMVDQMGYINHPDHVAIGQATLHAVFPSAETRLIFPELLAEGLEPHKVKELWMMLSAQEATFVDVTAQLERKLAALRCHASQVNEEAITMVREWMQEAGQKAGCEYAESFRVINLVPPGQPQDNI